MGMLGKPTSSLMSGGTEIPNCVTIRISLTDLAVAGKGLAGDWTTVRWTSYSTFRSTCSHHSSRYQREAAREGQDVRD